MARIDQDQRRFRKILKGKIRKNLRKYVSDHRITGKKGNQKVSIPVPRIGLPRFVFKPKEKTGVSHGPGEVGDPLGGKGKGSGGGPGDLEGDHALELEVSLDEMLDILGEELKLPRIEPKGTSIFESDKRQYNTIAPEGPEALRHPKRTYKRALKRMIASGAYDAKDPLVIPRREDRRYKASKKIPKPVTQAVVIYMMDVSGSMGKKQKELVRTTCFWLDSWLDREYKGIQKRYIIHDVRAKEVDEYTFYRTQESGGTRISSAYRLASEIQQQDYPVEDWNIYFFHFSDGDNAGSDMDDAILLLRHHLLPVANQVAYGQVLSAFGSGQFGELLEIAMYDYKKFALCNIDARSHILDALKTFLGEGW